MRVRLRWKILLFTVVPPLALTAATLWTVDRSVTAQVHDGIEDNLRRSSLVFEHLLAARSRRLQVTAEGIVADPRFSSLLSLPATGLDPHFRATVREVARDFNAITRADLFEVFDRRGRLIASVGATASSDSGRLALLDPALLGQPVNGVLADGAAPSQVVVLPVRASGRVVGAVLLGAAIDGALARELEALTHSEVAFLSAGVCNVSTFEAPTDERALLTALERPGIRPAAGARRETMIELRGKTERYLALVRRVPHSSPGQRELYAMVRSLDAETAYLLDMQRRLTRLGIFAAALAALAGLLIAERVTRPVQRLVRGAEEMERGNYEFPLEVRYRDEIGELTTRFRTMREQERAYVSSLREVARLKGEFITVASHELRTPVSVIQGYLELLSDQTLGPLAPRQREAIAAAGRSIQRLTGIAEEATKMAQMDERGRRPEDDEHAPGAIVRRAVAAARASDRDRELPIAIECGPGLEHAGTDPRGLGETIAHLVRSALLSTPDGGSVSVSVRRESSDLVVEIHARGARDPSTEQGELFRDFESRSAGPSGDPAEKLGLGLSIANRFAQSRAGTLIVETLPGLTCRYLLRIPLETTEHRHAA